MFTGIITHIGVVHSIAKTGDWRFVVQAEGFTHQLALGASVAHSGVCLTVIEQAEHSFTVQVSQETLSRTTLGQWQEGTRINLERALKVGDELGGHFVSGHVDGLARLEQVETIGESWKTTFVAPRALAPFIAAKGSVTLDGVSLTVNAVEGERFWVNIIPHTLQATTLGERKAGDSVNLEIDLLARYLMRLREMA
jgi:riboflavin synthase